MEVYSMSEYLPRIIDKQIEKYLRVIGAILIIGPKWCGKTTTAMEHTNSMLKLQSNQKDYYYQVAEINPKQLLNGEKPKLIDEWQITPILWDIIRNDVDESNDKGLYILTGSTVVNDSEIMHTGTGRIHRMLMMPMSLYESKDSNGQISLSELFQNPDMDISTCISDLKVEDIAFVACRGGWPESLNIENREDQLLIASLYFDAICESDVSAIDGIKRDSNRVRYILRSYSRNISTLAKDKTILSDITHEYGDIGKTTYYDYIDALKRLFVIKNIDGWSPNIRSANMIRKGTKKEFIDPSIAIAALDLSPERLMNDIKTFGFIFENLCIRDLTIYINDIGGNIYYYNDNYGLEADAVLQLKNGDYALIEIKLGSREIEKGAKNLLKLKKLIQEKKDKEKLNIPNPKFLAIITGGEFAYTRKDGVKVIPIGCLKN